MEKIVFFNETDQSGANDQTIPRYLVRIEKLDLLRSDMQLNERFIRDAFG